MKKILIVEDDKFLANAYRSKIEENGCWVYIAENGVEALEALKKFRPDLILLDLILPIKDGFATLKELKASPQLSTIPVIAMSTLEQNEDIDKALKLGAVEFIQKDGLTLRDLFAKIEPFIKDTPAPSPKT